MTFGWAAMVVAPVASGAALIRQGWAPVFGERGTIAALTVDSLSRDPPLVGMPTSLGFEDGASLSHAGPLGFWLLAIPTQLLGEPGHGLIVGALAVALLSIASVAALMRRHGDVHLEALALVLVAAMVAGIGGGILADPFNPYLGVLPLLLCLVSTWGVLAGHHRQLWVLVLAGSLTAQVHLGYVLLVVSLVALASVSLAADIMRGAGPRRRRLTNRIIPIGVLLGLAAWTGPILDQLLGTGNLVRLWRSQFGDRPVAGIDHGVDVAVEMTSIPPRWLVGRATDGFLDDPSSVRVVFSLVSIVLVVALGIRTIRRRDRVTASLSVVSIVSIVAATLSTARLLEVYPGYFDSERLLFYRLFWWPVGMFFTLTLVWGSVRSVALTPIHGAGSGVSRDLAGRWTSVIAVVGVVLIAPLGYRSAPEGAEAIYEHDVVHAEAIAGLPGSPSSVALRFHPEGHPPPAPNHPAYTVSMGLVAQLRLRGIAVRFPADGEQRVAVRGYRAEHWASGDEPVVLLYRAGADARLDPPPGYRRISITGPAPDEPINPLSVESTVFVRS